MKWENVLKVQITGSKQKVKMGNIPIPVEEEEDCEERFNRFISRIEELSNKTSDEHWIHSAYSHSFGLIDYCEVLELLNKIGNEYNTNQVVQRYVVGKMHGFVVFSKNDVENSYYATGFELYVKGNVDGKDTSIPVRFIIFGLGIEDVRMVYNWEKTIESLIKLCKEA